jgi:DUF2975 family protein
MVQTRARRRSWLAAIRVLLMLLLIGDVLSLPLLIIGHGAVRVGTVDVGVFFAGEPYAAARQRFPSVFPGDVEVFASHASRTQVLLYVLGRGVVSGLLAIPVYGYAIKLIDEARKADPFTLAMVRGLRRLGLMILALGVLSEAAVGITQAVLLQLALPHDRRFGGAFAHSNYRPSLWWLVAGLVVLAFSEVVKRGCDLRAELDEVI